MRNVALGPRTAADIDGQVKKILRGLGNPEPPIDLRMVRELLKLDRQFYSSTDDGFVREVFSRMKVAGQQVLQRPTLLKEAIQKLSLKALYLPDSKRILIDADVPQLKHRWNEAHEIGHSIIPWHEGIMFGDDTVTLTPHFHEEIEAEANYAAGRLLFMSDRFGAEATARAPSLDLIRGLSTQYGNTITSTLWRFVEQAEAQRPMVALVTGHPHRSRRKADFDAANPCRYCVQSPLFRANFGRLTDADLFGIVAGYSGPQRAGPLGEAEVRLVNDDGQRHLFNFETFFNGYEALTLGVWQKSEPLVH
ncbi:ImmA/IrrE family metallo-endopeptidase [Mesorhizobium ciceri]|uniref:ImmA/IrrE family metallo-endopeptidase n=1 Tax=Mesorhizobium TaxID=68287 RepID=UPI0007A947CA|nr:ImmA/IrrE family metallo-endopeptidase [Mesorhizobium ciceri]AMX98801.1 peptidase [Mesorhizobium ciceri biovar biserrulae]